MNCPKCAEEMPDEARIHSCGWKKTSQPEAKKSRDINCAFVRDGRRCQVLATIFPGVSGDKHSGMCTWHGFSMGIHNVKADEKIYDDWLAYMKAKYPSQQFWLPETKHITWLMVNGTREPQKVTDMYKRQGITMELVG